MAKHDTGKSDFIHIKENLKEEILYHIEIRIFIIKSEKSKDNYYNENSDKDIYRILVDLDFFVFEFHL